MRHRRDFITLLGGAAAWPVVARAQQPAVPVIGWLSASTPESDALILRPFRQALNAQGFVEGRNVAIEFRWTEGQIDRLPGMAADLVQRRVSVIVTTASVPAINAAKAATAAIPIVFQTAADPVAFGLVASLSRPGGNVTGATSLNVEVGAKRLELLHELVPRATVIALLVNPTSPIAEAYSRDAQAAARTLGLQLNVLRASTEHEIDTAFTTLVQLRAGGLVIGADAFFNSQSEQLAGLTVRHAIPAVYSLRRFAAAGGLMSYGGDITEQYRQIGDYTGRILKGEKPADLPVLQPTKFEFIINLKTAKALGLFVSNQMQLLADEVIE
jgi:putative tryptophan/tyrosine transport system substrate-binding protein